MRSFEARLNALEKAIPEPVGDPLARLSDAELLYLAQGGTLRGVRISRDGQETLRQFAIVHREMMQRLGIAVAISEC